MEQQWTTITVCIFYVTCYHPSERSFFSCLGHVVNLGNVDIMQRITKIAVVENATAIWEYDPSREDNRVLGGSLDVIAAIRTLAIKVSMFISPLSWRYTSYLIRSRLQDNVSSTFRAFRFDVSFLRHWRSLCTAISVGELPTRCLTRQTHSVRQVLPISILFHILMISIFSLLPSS